MKVDNEYVAAAAGGGGSTGDFELNEEARTTAIALRLQIIHHPEPEKPRDKGLKCSVIPYATPEPSFIFRDIPKYLKKPETRNQGGRNCYRSIFVVQGRRVSLSFYVYRVWYCLLFGQRCVFANFLSVYFADRRAGPRFSTATDSSRNMVRWVLPA